jgi:hypothetical protein
LKSVVTSEGGWSGVAFVATWADRKPSRRDPWKVTLRERINAQLMQVMALEENGCTRRRGASLAHRYVDRKAVYFGTVVKRSEFMACPLETYQFEALIREDRVSQAVGVFRFLISLVSSEHLQLL